LSTTKCTNEVLAVQNILPTQQAHYEVEINNLSDIRAKRKQNIMIDLDTKLSDGD